MYPQFSVVIPVYNAEKWISCCVNSILGQSYQSWELICINDGSDDESGKILDGFVKDYRVRIIHKENAGVSAARNDGIKAAKGTYVIFVDADDYLHPKALQVLNDCLVANDPDVLHYLFSPTTHPVHDFCSSEYKGNIKWVKDGGLSACSGFVWDKVYKLDLIKSNNVFFDEKMTLCEDFHFFFRYAALCSKICYTNAAIYVKRPTPDGLCHSAVRKWETAPENAIANICLLSGLAEWCNQVPDSERRKALRVFLLNRSIELHLFFLYKLYAINKSPIRERLLANLHFPFKELTQELTFSTIARTLYSSLKSMVRKSENKFLRYIRKLRFGII